MKITETQPRTSKWLRRTQENSWEPEILISGIVLLALTQVPRLLDDVHYFMEMRTFPFIDGNIDDKLFALLKSATYWLIIMLIMHLILRSMWLSFVGLSYAFPEGVKMDRLKYRPFFADRIRRLPGFESSVIRLEKICSTIYSIAFLLVLAIISAFLYLIVIFVITLGLISFFPNAHWSDGFVDNLMTTIILLTGLPYLIDFLTLGALKRIRWFWKIYRPVYIVMSFITFASLYRGIYYGLVSNLNRYVLFGGMVVFVWFTAWNVSSERSFFDNTSLVNPNSTAVSAFEGYYRDRDLDRLSKNAHIQSDIIDNGVINLFVVNRKSEEERIISMCPEYESKMSQINTSSDFYYLRKGRLDSLDLNCIVNYHRFEIDGKALVPNQWYTQSNYKSGQEGIVTFLDIDSLDRGHHVLEIFQNRYDFNFKIARIPFFKSSIKSSSKSKDAFLVQDTLKVLHSE